MKRFLKVFVPILLAVAIIFGIGWYLFSYDKGFTQDMLLSFGRYFASANHMQTASWFYDRAYAQNYDTDSVAVEYAEKYIESGNYTKAEAILQKAISDGAGSQVYIALSKTFVAQDKLYDAVELLDGITNATVKKELDALRPASPTSPNEEASYNSLISVSVEAPGHKLYVNANGEYPSVLQHAYDAPIPLIEGENSLYAVAVSDSGLVSPLRILKYTIHGVIEQITFQDSAVEAEIRKLLNTSDNEIIYSNQLWDIKEFTVPAEARRYDDLRYMLYLETLTIENGISDQLQVLHNSTESFCESLTTLTIRNVSLSSADLEFISTLTNLETLTLDSCGISTTAPLVNLTKLVNLNLNNNAIRNITALSILSKLEQLSMQRNALTDLSSIAACTALKKLDISYNSVTSISDLSVLTSITELDISHNQISDLNSIAQMQALKRLVASDNQITDIAPLSACAKLEYLNLSNNRIESLNALVNHTAITYLNFSRNQVSQLPAWSENATFVTIDGSYNQITELDPLAKLKNLNNVLMDYNENITSIDVLAQCPVLIQVNVYGTKVKEVDVLTDQSIIVNYNPLSEENN